MSIDDETRTGIAAADALIDRLIAERDAWKQHAENEDSLDARCCTEALARAEAAEARIAAARRLADEWSRECITGGGGDVMAADLRAALSASPEPQQEPTCATCGDDPRGVPIPPPDGARRYVMEFGPCPSCTPQRSACATCEGRGWILDWEQDHTVPCPSCTPPDPAPHRGAEIDCCEDDPDAWFAVCPECGWQSPQGRSRHEVATALTHHQANPTAASPDPESETR